MEITDRFRRFLKAIIKERKIKQTDIAKMCDSSKTLINDYLKNRKPLSETKREMIAEKLGFHYEISLLIGRELINKTIMTIQEYAEKSNNVIKIDKKIIEHQNLVSGFKDQDKGIRVNKKLIYVESLDETSIDRIEGYINREIEEIEEAVGKDVANQGD